MIKLGNRVKDSITGYEGTVVGRTEWMYGYTRIGVQSQIPKDSKVLEPKWFDEQLLHLIKDSKIKVSKDSAAKTGGPMKDPRQ